MKESTIVTNILQFLRTRERVFAWKEHGGRFGTAGLPDIVACVDGMFVGLEVKAPSGKLTLLQQATLERIRAAGGVAEKVTSVDEVQTIINSIEGGAAE